MKFFSYKINKTQKLLNKNQISDIDYLFFQKLLEKKDQIFLYHSLKHKLVSFHPYRNMKQIEANTINFLNMKNIGELIFNELILQ